ncbi:hypothetical protein [Mesorhizobium ciceri]|uniref:hypothetical protein n=1 Tax=Mesorhizobium TaxID=68287 RepID=UPI0012DCEAB1|nr:hypothetical protein [Mesorhizobium ciceri]
MEQISMAGEQEWVAEPAAYPVGRDWYRADLELHAVSTTNGRNRAAAIKEYLPKNVLIIQYIRLVGERFGALNLVKAYRASHRGKETSNFCPIVRNL